MAAFPPGTLDFNCTFFDGHRRVIYLGVALLSVVLAIAALYVGAAIVIFVRMRWSINVAGRTLAVLPRRAFRIFPFAWMWCTARKGTLAVGQVAPDFELTTRDGASRIRLSSLRNSKPVVLVFGSYTCPPFRDVMPAINDVYRDFNDRASFRFVYLAEAHARDVWPLKINARENVDYTTHKDLSERMAVANICADEMKIEFPMLVDDMNNSVERAYTAWPTRLYVVNRSGIILFKSRTGPYGFEADVLRRALAAIIPAG